MAPVLVKQLIEAGVHFGHRASRWNPKMRPYIYARQNLIHIIDVRETIRGLLRAKKYLKQVASGGSLVLFVGTKRQAGETIERESERCGMPYVSDRWLGGTLTNFRTIRNRLTRLEAARTIALQRTAGHVLQKDAVGPDSRISQDVSQPARHADHESFAGVPGRDRSEKRAQRDSSEAQKLGITTVALIDTDSDPDVVDLPIPGNDDSIRSIELIVQQLADAILEGKSSTTSDIEQQKSEDGDAQAAG